MKFTAAITHNESTVKRFTALQYGTFEFGRRVVLLLFSLGLIVYGASRLLTGESIIAIILLFLGCILLTNIDHRAESIADEVIKAMNGSFPTLSYSFGEDSFTDGENRPAVPYSRIYRLISDDEYLYIFTGKATGYMFPAGSVQDASGALAAEELKSFLCEKSGLEWTRPLALMSFSLKDIKTILRKRSR